jgi:hypothetical protein
MHSKLGLMEKRRSSFEKVDLQNCTYPVNTALEEMTHEENDVDDK